MRRIAEAVPIAQPCLVLGYDVLGDGAAIDVLNDHAVRACSVRGAIAARDPLDAFAQPLPHELEYTVMTVRVIAAPPVDCMC